MIAALVCSLLSPASAGIHHTAMRQVCHGTAAVHHCEMTEMNDADSDTGSDSVVSNAGPKCPMDCCALAYVAPVATPSQAFLLAPVTVSERGLHVAQVVFTASGFSSHTDRGPPLS